MTSNLFPGEGGIGRVRFERRPDGLIVLAPLPRRTAMLVAAPVLLAGAALVAWLAPPLLRIPALLGGAAGLWQLVWLLTRRETLIVGPDRVVLDHRAAGYGTRREFDRERVANWRVVPAPGTGPLETALGQYSAADREGPLGFDHAGRTIRFGAGLTEAEARDLLDRLRREGVAAATVRAAART